MVEWLLIELGGLLFLLLNTVCTRNSHFDSAFRLKGYTDRSRKLNSWKLNEKGRKFNKKKFIFFFLNTKI